MASNFGLKVGVEGEKQFKQALREINQSLKTAASEAKLVASQYDANDKSVEALAARNGALSKEIDKQIEKQELLQEALKNATETFGENSKEAQLWQQKLNETQATINTMTREVEKNEAAIQAAANAEEDGAASAEEFGEATKEAGKESEDAGRKFEALGKIAGAVGAALAASAAAIGAAMAEVGKALVEMTTGGAKYADQVRTQSAVTGIATDKLQEYMYAAELVDFSTETLTASMTRTVRAMNSAAQGTKSYTEAFEKLGVSVTDANGELRNSQDVYWEIIDALGKIDNETERDALAMEIMGKSARELNPLIKAGAEQMAAFAAEARESGYVLSDDLLDRYGALDDQLRRLDSGATAAKNALGTILLPVLNDLAGEGVDLLGEFSRGVLGADGDINKMAEVLDGVLPKALDVVVKYVPTIVEIAGTIVSALAGALIDNAPAIIDAIGEVLNKLVDFAAENIPAIVQSVITLLNKILVGIIENLPTIIRALEEVLPILLDGLQDLMAAVGKALVDNLPEIIRAINSIVLTLTKQIAGHLPEFVKTVLEIITGVAGALLEATPEIVETIGETIPIIVQAVLDCLPFIIDAVVQIIRALANNLPTIIQAVVDVIPDVIGQVVQAVIDCLPAIIKGILTLVKEIAKRLPEIIVSIADAIPKLIGNIVDAVIECLPQLIKCVVEIIGEIVKNLPEIIVAILEKIPDLIGSIVGGIIGCVGQFVEAGGKLLSGVWEGIKGAAGWLWEQISGFFSGIVDGIVSIFRGEKIKDLGKDIADDLNAGYEGAQETTAPQVNGPYLPTGVESTVAGLYPASADYYARQQTIGQGGQYERYGDVIGILEQIAEKPLVVAIGDEQIGIANNNYQARRGAVVQEGAFANAN